MAAADVISSLRCIICGDDASAYNFGALSCESCKAFFRRATRSSKVPMCIFSGNCMVSQKTRSFCVACRLRKCQTAGMNKLLVLSEEQRKDRNQLIESNRLLRKHLLHSGRTAPGSLEARPSQLSRVSGSNGSGASLASIGAPHVAIGATLSAPSPLLLLQLPSQSVTSPRSLPDEQKQQQQLEENEGAAGYSEPAWCVTTRGRGGTPEASTAASASVNAPPSSVRHSDYVTPRPEDALANISAEMASDVWNVFSHQKPATAFLDGTTCCTEMTATLPQPPQSSLPSLPEQQQPWQPFSLRAAPSASFYRRCLSSQTCDALQHLTRLYRSQVVISRRSSSRRTTAINIVEETGRPEVRDAERENRLRHFADRLSDLLRCYTLFARELPDVARLPLQAQMALVKSCTPTFMLVCAAELYDKERAAWVDELGDVVPAAVIDDLVSELRRTPSVEDPIAVTSCRRRFFQLLSSVERHIPIHGPGRSSADRTVIALVQVIILQSPELLPPGIVRQDVMDALADGQQLHVYLLRQYLEATYSFEEAAELWPKLLCTLETCKRTAHCLSNLLLSCGAVRCDALLHEILQTPPA